MLVKPDGKTTQIDQIVVSQWGIFVLEIKNIRGWIYGHEGETSWTQQLSPKKRNQFGNPCNQNYGHIVTLSQRLGLPIEQFKSIIAFSNRAEFKKKLPDEVIHFNEVAKYIQSHSKTPIIPPETVPGLVLKIKELDAEVTPEQRKNHIKQCQERRKQKQATIKDTPPQPKTSQASTPQSSASVSTQNCQTLTNSVQQNSSTEVTPISKPIAFQPGALGWRLAQELDNQRYRVLPVNLKLPGDKDTTNYLILSEWGIFVVIHLRYKGTVYGNPEAHIWNTEYQEKYPFHNPLEQNNIHIMEWSRRLQLPPEYFHSVIAFNDGATFKREMPENVMLFSQVAEYVRQHSKTIVFSQSQLEALTNVVSDSKAFLDS